MERAYRSRPPPRRRTLIRSSARQSPWTVGVACHKAGPTVRSLSLASRLPRTKATRICSVRKKTLQALCELVRAAGLHQPGENTAHHIMRRLNRNDVRLLATRLPEVPAGASQRGSVESYKRNVCAF